jgi:hypothetical protein
MGTRLGAVMVLMLSLGNWGCGGPTVRTDFDAAADFTMFRTYAFGAMTDMNQGGVLNNSLTRKRLENMIGRQLSSKGLQEVGVNDNPDLLVHYWVGVKDKQQVVSTGGAAGAYGWRGGYGWGSGYGGVTTYEYTEGTLIVDLITPARNELVWRGRVVGTLTESNERDFQMANEGIAKAFTEYPPKTNKP